MAWDDFLYPAQAGAGALTPDQRSALTRQGLLQAGLSILANSRRPGVSPLASVSNGILSGMNTVQEGQKNITEDSYRQAQLAQQRLLVQRDQQLRSLAQKFTKPDGSLDEQAYIKAVGGIDPLEGMKLESEGLKRNLLKAQALQKQGNPSREINRGNNLITQELDPTTGKWGDISSAPRWQPQQTAGGDSMKGLQLVPDVNGNLQIVDLRSGSARPVMNAQGQQLQKSVPDQNGGARGIAAQMKAFDQRNKMQQEANNGVNAAYKAAAIMTGKSEDELRGLPLDQLHSTILQNGATTGPGSAVLHPLNYMALNSYGTQAAMANAVLNSQGGKPTDADIKYGKTSSFGPDKNKDLNADLIVQQISRAQDVANQINTLKTQFQNGGGLPEGVTQGGVGISQVPGSVNQPYAPQYQSPVNPLMSSPKGKSTLQLRPPVTKTSGNNYGF